MTKISKTSSLTDTVLLLQVTLSWSKERNSLEAWVDSGVDVNFMDVSLAKKLSLPSESHSSGCYWVGNLSATEKLSTKHFHSLLSILQHQEEISFLPIHSPASLVILGYTWLLWHNLKIDWSTNSILQWGPTSLARCNFSSSPDAFSQSQESLDFSRVPPM